MFELYSNTSAYKGNRMINAINSANTLQRKTNPATKAAQSAVSQNTNYAPLNNLSNFNALGASQVKFGSTFIDEKNYVVILYAQINISSEIEKAKKALRKISEKKAIGNFIDNISGGRDRLSHLEYRTLYTRGQHVYAQYRQKLKELSTKKGIEALRQECEAQIKDNPSQLSRKERRLSVEAVSYDWAIDAVEEMVENVGTLFTKSPFD